jgi:aminopeptidase N
VREWEEEKYSACQWIGDLPLAVAGFNYGNFLVKEAKVKDFDYAVYANRELPDQLKRIQIRAEEIEREGEVIDMPLGSLSTVGLAKSALDEAMISIRIFNHYFGQNPYGRIVMSQQPDPRFAQSWPMLVYMSYLAYLDSTQRVMLGIPVHEFTEEVGSHEIAHQWWGHLVGWKTYHDQWLSEGFADFSVSLYLEQAYHKDAKKRYDRFLKFWEEQKKGIIEKIPLGTKGTSMRPNDVGPLWLGSRLDSGRTGGAYFPVTYKKGSFVLHMLRMLMMDTRAQPDRRDDRFMAMMRDFVETHRHHSASTEDFQRMVEKHMTPEMDQDGNSRMDWFFNQWVYGTDLPHYRLEYGFGSSPDGKPLLRLSLTQSQVSPDFKMPLPIYLDFGQGRSIRLNARITGNNTVSNEIALPEKPKSVKLCANYDVLCTIEEVKAK